MAENYREPEIIFEGWTAPEGTGIIVTGAASGIGAATAILAAQSGLKVGLGYVCTGNRRNHRAGRRGL